MTSFARYYQDNELIEVSMRDMEELIKHEKHREQIATHVYERLYGRFLKIFEFDCDRKKTYKKYGKKENKYTFNEEFKSGFLQLASCSLLIETFAAFLEGEDETPTGKGSERFNSVFKYPKDKNNGLKIFYKTNKKKNEFYQNIRNGILHQGETKGNWKVTREGNSLTDKDNRIIDANLFFEELKSLLLAYKNDLEDEQQCSWDGKYWDACRQKIRYIINNSK